MLTLPDRLTARLVLTRPTAADRDDIFRLFSDPRVMATLGGLVPEAVIQERFERLLRNWVDDDFGLWILRDRESGAFIGRGGLRRLTLEGKPEVEVGYALLPEFWGRGLATELAQESVRAAFEELQLPDLVCFPLPTNKASQRVMEKAGFRYERDGTYADLPHRFCRLTAAQWRER
jgi:ribosomal-protein-alanine N-acetyltransferase